jgi:hypothetical protein
MNGHRPFRAPETAHFCGVPGLLERILAQTLLTRAHAGLTRRKNKQHTRLKEHLHMWIRRPVRLLHAVVSCWAASLVFLASNAACAQTAELKECATQYQAAKADNKLSGQAWQDFFTDCKARLSAAAPKSETPEAAAPALAAAPKTEPDKGEAPKVEAAPAHLTAAEDHHSAPLKDDKAAAEAREKKCRAEWKSEAAELKKKDSKFTWNKFWKQCNARLTSAKQ